MLDHDNARRGKDKIACFNDDIQGINYFALATITAAPEAAKL